MAAKPDKPKKKTPKPKGKEKGVMAALPSTRPERIGSTREAPDSGSTPAPQPATKAKPKATAARRVAAAPRTFEPTRAAEAAAGAADERAAGAVPLAQTPPRPRDPETAYPRPRPVSAGEPGIGTTGYRDEPASDRRPRGVRLAEQAARTAGEVALAGFSLGGRLVKRAADRLPKP